MSKTKIYITLSDGIHRNIEWPELNDLKKDILWVFVENTNQLNAAFIPTDSFKKPYWEYLALEGNQWFEHEKAFYINGVLIILLCMTLEYLDTSSGDQSIFMGTDIEEIVEHVNRAQITIPKQDKLKKLLTTALRMADEMTPEDLLNTEFEHPDSDKLYNHLEWVDETFIKSYFKDLVSSNE